MVPALLIPASPPDPAWPESALAGTAPAREPPDEEPWDEEPPADEALAEEPWDENPPAEEHPDEEPPGDEAPAELVPIEEPPVDVVPAEERSAGQIPVETPPAAASSEAAPSDAESPADKVPDGESPADVASVEVPPDGVGSAEAAPGEEPPAEPPAAVVAPAGVAPAEEPPVDVAPAEERSVEESPDEEPAGEASPDHVTPAGTPLADEIPATPPLADEAPAGVFPVGVAAAEGRSGVAQPTADRAETIPPGRPRPATPSPATPRPGTNSPGPTHPVEPGWGTVLATTVRLWTRRRLANPRWRAAFALLLAVIVIGAVAVPLALSKASPGGQQASQGRSQAGSGSTGPVGAAAARRQAAAWVAQQVNGDAIVACDPAMCGALQKAGIPAGRLLALGSGQNDPLGSDILVATAAVRSQFGSRLAGVYAPVVIAAFGTGAALIQVRVEAPDGAAAYRAGLAADVAARKAAGVQMLHNGAIEVSPAVRRQLVSGQVDSRLLETLVTLSHAYRIDIISFGAGPASGVTPGVPLRFAEIAGAARGGQRPASLHTLRAFLSAQRTPYRPSWVARQQIASRSVLRVEYPAPSPLGLLGSHG